MSDETPQERQDNEFEVLQSMFCGDIVDKRENIAWKVWRPLDILLTLYPVRTSSNGENHCSITLHIKCCADYPNQPPALSIHKLNGLSNENAAKLMQELESLARQSCGEVMIYTLAEHVQNFLVPFNKPSLSFYDQMMEQRNEKKKIKDIDENVKDTEERQKIREEIEKRKQILREAGRQRPNRTISVQSENNEEVDAPELVYFADKKPPPAKKVKEKCVTTDACTCNKGIQILRITQKNNKKIHIGRCLGHSTTGATTYLAIDAETGEYIIANKWSLPPPTDFPTRNRLLTLIDQDLKTMCRLKHPSLIPYTAVETQQEIVKKNSQQCVYIFREFVLGCPLADIKTVLNSFSDSSKALKLLRHVGTGVLSALNVLHNSGLKHRDVRCENVFLDAAGTVKLVGASLDTRLAGVLVAEDNCERQTKAQDISATAKMLLSLISSSEEDGVIPIPSHLPSAAKDFFERCLTQEEGLQWSAEQLMGHSFLLDAPSAAPNLPQQDQSDSGSEEDVKKLVQTLVQNSSNSNQSRLVEEFEVLKWLGKGAFGDVLKVKNKLDGGYYAIKRVKLNPENIHLNKKITREVKLISRLSHENVVRYYNAWMETMNVDNGDAFLTSESPTDPEFSAVKEDQLKSPAKQAKPSLDAVLAKLQMPGIKLEWSMDSRPSRPEKSESDDEGDEEEIEDEDDDDDEVNREWCRVNSSKKAEDASSSILFEDGSSQSESLPSAETPEQTRAASSPPGRIQVLFIQMEFCEKNTLRHAIDNGLYLENFRIWRLFREMVSGLSHVHQAGMIHRDLKPMNVFLDSRDHVKIGDFGLATKAFKALPVAADGDKEKMEEMIGGSLTGQVGTALYVAPELLKGTTKIIYNQKVDLYSLGIILFEMVHPPLATGMERISVLTDLRQKDIVMPETFVRSENEKLIRVIRWLLDHEPSKRPTCTELLSSEHVPRPLHGPVLTGQLSYALSAKGSREYKRLVNSCLDQTVSPAEDFTYITDFHQPDAMLQLFKDVVIKVFRTHGAIEFSPPLLLPRTKGREQSAHAVKLMTASGFVCHLPHDLRMPFARQLAYSRGPVSNMRRYTVERVYREPAAEGFHPREIVECAFDIVTARTESLWPDSELLVVAHRAVSAVTLRVLITVNHSLLLRHVLSGCGVPRDRQTDLYPILDDVRAGRIANLQLKTHLSSLCITDNNVIRLMKLMESEVPLSQIRELMAQFAFKRDEHRKITAAINDIESVIKKAEAMGLECTTTISPCLTYNALQHSGVFWQMYAQYGERRRSAARHRARDLIASGGRYDTLVQEYRTFANMDDGEREKTGVVGFSLSLVRILSIHRRLKYEPPAVRAIESTKICVCIKSREEVGRDKSAPRIARLARDLWAAGHVVCTCDCNSASEAHELTGAGIVLIDDLNSICVFIWDDTRVREHRMPFIEVVDFIKQKINPDCLRTPEGNPSRSVSWSEDRNEKTSGANVSVYFAAAAAGDRMTKNARRQCENQINNQITLSLTRLGLSSVLSRCRVLAVALGCTADCVKMLAAQLESPLQAAAIPAAIRAVQEIFPRRRKLLDETRDELTSILASQNNQPRSSDEIVIYALYSIPDSICRIIT